MTSVAWSPPPSPPLPGACLAICQQEALWLLPQRAIWWPAREALLVADVHFGKAASFRRAGVPVPHGTTDDNIRRLEALIDACAARQLIVLGDFLHDRTAQQAATMDKLLAWRARRPSLRCVVVGGNHDRHAGRLQTALDIEVVTEPWSLGPFALCHHPGAQIERQASETAETLAAEQRDRQTGRKAAPYGMAGHLHPAFVLRGAAGDRLRLPCFVFDQLGAVLPAFGEFTGHATVRRAPGQQVYVIGDQRVWPVPGG